MATYVNDLRLKEIATGDEAGTWGTSTNTNLELIGEAFSFGTEAITTNADTHTTTIADGSTDPGRSMYLKYTGTLDSACTITIGPNTVSKMWFIENATSGSQNIIISQGSGANITIPAGDVKVVYSDGAGSGAAVVDAFASLSVVDLKVQDDLTVTDDMTVGGTLGVTGVLTATSLDISGDIDVDGTTNLDVVDIDGAVDMASTLTVAGVLTGASLDISGDIDVDGTTNLDVVDIDGAVDMASTLNVSGAITGTLATAAQPNITSVGTLTGLDVAGTPTFDGLTVDASSGIIQSATGTASPTATTFNISTTSNGSDWSTTSPWGRLAFYSSDGSGSGGKPHVVLDATASNAIGASSSFSVSTTSESANTLTKRLNMANNGDISFYEDTGTSQALFWDASAESLGIGTTSPARKVQIQDTSSTPYLSLVGPTNASAGIMFGDSDDETMGRVTYDNSNNSMQFWTNDSQKMLIDSSGNVGIGTSVIPAYWSGYAALQLGVDNSIFSNAATGVDSALFIGQNLYNDGSNYKYTGASSNEGSLIDMRNGTFSFLNAPAGTGTATLTNRMTIDSSGIVGIGNTVAGTIHGVSTVSNLVVGTGSGNNGIGVYSGTSNLGAITFADGTSGNTTYRGGITYNHSTDHLELNGNGGTAHVIVHASGVTSIPSGIELGSGLDATAANTLDDYEEGTWTPTVEGASTGGSYTLSGITAEYTKVGNVVTLKAQFGFSAASGGTSYARVHGLPFSYAAGAGVFGTLRADNYNFQAADPVTVIIAATTSGSGSTLNFLEIQDNTGPIDAPVTGISTSTIIGFTITYQTS